jgi:hypothetical protein
VVVVTSHFDAPKKLSSEIDGPKSTQVAKSAGIDGRIVVLKVGWD